MKKILCFLMVAFMATVSMNAQNGQKALVEQKFWDNWYIGINGGVTTPLSFDEITPLNPTVGLRVGKEFTPVFGVNVEGTAWLGSHTDIGKTIFRFDGDRHLVVRGTNLGVNGTVNFSNLFGGYNGKPRVFEMIGIVGAGWWHTFSKDEIHGYTSNDLTSKTGVDLNFNLGSKRAHSFYLEPYVLWNLGSAPRQIQFNKNYAQFGLNVGYTYHFKTSNGEHYFVEYDVDALNDEINMLRSREPEVKIVETEKIIEKIVEVPVVQNTGVITIGFAKGSSKLTDTAKDILNTIPKGTKVEVVGTASPEGTNAKNDELAQERADAASQYLLKRGVNVLSSKGLGATGDDSQRIVRVQIVK